MAPDIPDRQRPPQTDRALVPLTPRFRAKSSLLRWFQESAAFLASSEGRQQLQATLVNGRSGLGAAGLGTVMLMFWNATLVFSTGAGMGTMVLLYLLQDEQWRKEKLPQLKDQLQHQLEGLNQPFLWSAIGGGGAAFLSYLTIAAWGETDSHWLATGILLQGLLTCGVLGLGLRQFWDRKAENIDSLEFSHWVEKLSHEDPVARLLAVRQLTTIVPSLTLNQQKELLEYFQLRVSREPEDLVKEALWQALEALSPNFSLLTEMDDAAPLEADRAQAKIKAWVEHEEV
jgi:hypothetical protein